MRRLCVEDRQLASTDGRAGCISSKFLKLMQSLPCESFELYNVLYNVLYNTVI
jgi:hypothetical protein